jgi:crotonobetainyl-CoA:carnitine CoA-transferase CaiB-like acyl-CoA transferase
VKLSRTPADPARAPGPALGEHTREVLEQLGYDGDEVERLLASGAAQGPVAETRGSFLG